jgi:hypothetical protein
MRPDRLLTIGRIALAEKKIKILRETEKPQLALGFFL